MENVKRALIESKGLLEYYIENIDDLGYEEMQGVKLFISSLNHGCECDDYNGFDCGCSRRHSLYHEAMEEILKQENE